MEIFMQRSPFMIYEDNKPHPCTRCDRKIVLAVDQSEQSKRAVEYGFANYEQWGACVQQHNEEAKKLLIETNKHCRELIKQRLRQLKKCHRVDSCEEHPEHHETYGTEHVQLFKETGKPAEGICHFAKDYEADLIVTGSRGLGAVKRSFLVSVSDYIAHHGHIPIAVVPPEHHCKHHTQQHQQENVPHQDTHHHDNAPTQQQQENVPAVQTHQQDVPME